MPRLAWVSSASSQRCATANHVHAGAKQAWHVCHGCVAGLRRKPAGRGILGQQTAAAKRHLGYGAHEGAPMKGRRDRTPRRVLHPSCCGWAKSSAAWNWTEWLRWPTASPSAGPAHRHSQLLNAARRRGAPPAPLQQLASQTLKKEGAQPQGGAVVVLATPGNQCRPARVSGAGRPATPSSWPRP